MMRKIAGLLGAAAGAWLLASTAAATVVNYAITSESGHIMYTDLGNGLNATYLVFQVTADQNVPDVWLKLDTTGSSIISNVGTGVHELKFNMSTGAHGSVPTPGVGLVQNVPKAVFFLVKASATTAVNQPLVVRLYDGDPSGSGVQQASQSFNFTVEDTIQANANKVNTVVTIPNNPQIGQLGTITVTGCTGTVGASKVLYFSPVSDDSWPADAFEFVDSDIQIDNYAGSPYRGVALIPNGDVLTTDNCYDEIFTFQIDDFGSATTTPANFITSGGTNIKHTTNSSGSFAVVIPLQCDTAPVTVTPSPLTIPTIVVGSGAIQTVTFTATQTGGTAFTITETGTLPNGVNFLQTSPTTATISGTPTQAGTFNVVIEATNTNLTDPAGCQGTTNFSFTVDPLPPPPPPPAATVPTLGGAGFALLALGIAGAAFLVIRRA
jgi:hypothetical protein